MQLARMGHASGHLIDVYTASKEPLFRQKFVAELQKLCAADDALKVTVMQPQRQGEQAPARSVSILVIDQPDLSSADLEKSIASMTGDRGLILIQSDNVPSALAQHAGTAHGFFASQDFSTLLQPVRQLTTSGGLIGIDLADFFSVWDGRLVRPMRVPARELQTAVERALPFEGAVISFPGSMSLAEIDQAIDTMKRALEPSCELVWQDFNHANDGLCDVGLAYQLKR